MKNVMKRILVSFLTFSLIISMVPDVEFIKKDDGGVAVQFDAGPKEVLAADNTDAEVTGLDEWDYDKDARYVYLKEYRGNKKKIRIPASFRVEEIEYSTQLVSLGGKDTNAAFLKSVTFDKGVILVQTYDTEKIFEGCRGENSNLEYLDMSGLNTAEDKCLLSMKGMFKDLPRLKYINLTGLNTYNVEDMSETFAGDTSLEELDLTSFSFDSVFKIQDCFKGDSSLKAIYVSSNWSILQESENDGVCTPENTSIFEGCTSLCGGRGTACDGVNNIGWEYCRIDEPNGEYSNQRLAGYFSAAPRADEWVYDPDDVDHINHTVILKGLKYKYPYSGIKNLIIPSKIQIEGNDYDVILKSLSDGDGIYYGVKHIMVLDGVKAAESISGLFDFTRNNTVRIDAPIDVERIDVSRLDTGSTTDMSKMFYHCKKLKSVQFGGNFTTANVTNMSEMFAMGTPVEPYSMDYFTSLTSLDLTSFDTSNVQNMQQMFYNCRLLTDLDLSSFNTGKVENMNGMFANCPTLTTIFTGSGFTATQYNDEGKTGEELMFYGCSSLTGGAGTTYADDKAGKLYAWIDGRDSKPGYFTSRETFVHKSAIDDWDWEFDKTSWGEKLGVILKGYKGDADSISIPANMDVKENDVVTSYPVILSSLKESSNKRLVSVSVNKGVKLIDNPDLSSHLFEGFDQLERADLKGLVTSVPDFSYMFAGCRSLTDVELPEKPENLGYKPWEVVSTEGMFESCSSLSELDLSGLSMNYCHHMNKMFSGCTNLKKIKGLENVLTTAVDMSSMFMDCSSLTELDLANFNTGPVERMDSMFEGCSSLLII